MRWNYADSKREKSTANSMHILIICQYFPPEMGAPAARVFEMARRWRSAGHRISVICGIPNHPTGQIYDGYAECSLKHEVLQGIHVYRTWVFITPNAGILRRSMNYFSFGVSALFAAETISEVDVCVATIPQFLSGLAGLIIAKTKRVKFILEVRDLWPEALDAVQIGVSKRVYNVLRRIELYMYRQAAHIVIVSPAFQTHMEMAHARMENITVIPNGVSTALFNCDPIHRDQIKIGLSKRFIVAYIGTHGMAHGLDVVLKAARTLLTEGDVHFLFIGEGAEKNLLLKNAADLTNVTFLDRQPRERIAQILMQVDVGLVVLRRAELFKTVIPSKMFEIMGAGKPIILGVEGQAAEILSAAQAGLAIEPENASQLVQAILFLKQNQNERKRFGENGYHFVRKMYNLDTLADHFLKLLQTYCPTCKDL